MRNITIAILFASFLIGSTVNVYSQEPELTVKVDKHVYAIGDLIQVSGTVPAVAEGKAVNVQIFNPKNVIVTDYLVTPKADGTYFAPVRVGAQFELVGMYTVKATYLEQTASTTFDFETLQVVSSHIGVEYEGQRIDLRYVITNGKIMSIEVDRESKSIIVLALTSSTQDGELAITLARVLIDSRTNGEDSNFAVLVDRQETNFEETSTSPIERALVIPIPAGAKEVVIIGTYVIPEFPLAIMIASVAIGVLITVMRFRKLQELKYA